MRVVIIDYGMGNLYSIVGALKYIGVKEIVLSNNEKLIKSSDKIILPGVGSFKKAMENIEKLNLKEILYKEVILNSKPILGICLGMQLLTLSSEEDGYSRGLEFVDAYVKSFDNISLRVPHVGFNQVKHNNTRLYTNIENNSDFYFTHSYFVESDKITNYSICDYGNSFIASFEVDNIVGVQFHPELSQINGLTLLDNFIKRF
jgi:glutamine amidotransferase